MFSPGRDPPEHRTWGVVPASWWIDAMMKHLDRSYYVGLLTAAAAIHGPERQAPQVFQVFVAHSINRALEPRPGSRRARRHP